MDNLDEGLKNNVGKNLKVRQTITLKERGFKGKDEILFITLVRLSAL